jgi:MerR family transcriptional regulator, light-induced transcriptional regulator
MTSVPQPGLTVAAAARRLGVAPATLRSWERRYGVGPTEHIMGARRRYTPDDLARLDRMRREILTGVAPAEAARIALGAATEQAEPAGGYSGRVFAVPDGNPRARGLARAAQALDAAAVRLAVGTALAEYGVITTWELLLAPVLRGVGERWAATGEGVEVEHLLVECASGCLRAVADAVPDSKIARPVLLACPDGESHSLPLHALHAALAERGLPSRVLGASTPAEAIASAVRRTGPAALFVYAHQPAAPGMLSVLPPTRPPTSVLVGGPGWDPGSTPARTTYAHDLGEAVHLIQLACGVG